MNILYWRSNPLQREIFAARKNPNKNYEIINEEAHGKSIVLKESEIIIN